MIITQCGRECFRVQFSDTVLAFNPVGKDSKLKTTSFGADIVLISLNHPDTNGADAVSRGDKKPFVISGPGEYEISGVIVEGYPSSSSYGGEKRHNTVYIVTLEDMRLCFLGAIDTNKLGKDLEEALEDVDVLFIPIGGDLPDSFGKKGSVLDPKSAHALGVSLEAKLVVPMHYDEKTLKTFLKEEGESNGKPLDKLTLKKKDLSDKEGDIVVLAST